MLMSARCVGFFLVRHTYLFLGNWSWRYTVIIEGSNAVGPAWRLETWPLVWSYDVRVGLWSGGLCFGAPSRVGVRQIP